MKTLTCAVCDREYLSADDFIRNTSKWRVCTQGCLWFECSCRSSLMLPKGEYEWYSPMINMGKKAATIFTQIAEIERLPTIPSQIIELQNRIADEHSTSKDIKEALKMLPDLALNVIDAANTLKEASGPQIKSLNHAITYLGRESVGNLVHAASLKEFNFKTKYFKKDLFWEQSILIGKIAEYIAKKFTPHLSKDEVYIGSSLCNIGKIVGAICFPEITDAIFLKTVDNKNPCSWRQAEQELNFFDHAILGEIAAAIWGFSPNLIHAIANHHTPFDKVAPLTCGGEVEFISEIDNICQAVENEEISITFQDIVAIANQYFHWISLEPVQIDTEILNGYGQKMGVSGNAIDTLGDELIKLFR